MGLLKKLAEKAAAGAPDYPVEIGRLLPPGESVRGVSHGYPLAFETDKSVRRQGVIGVGINLASQKIKESQHLGGEPGSAALSVPRNAESGHITVAITDQRLTMWSFGPSMRDLPPVPLVSFPLGEVASVARTGGSNRYGQYVRFLFTDNSFIDLAMMDHELYAPFFAAAQRIGG